MNTIKAPITLFFYVIPWLVLSLFSPQGHADFSLTSSTHFYTIDTDAGLVFSIRRTDNGSSTQSAGDLASLKIHGIEYQNQSRGSQVNSGFDYLYSGISAVQVDAAQIGNDVIKVTVEAGELTHYYLARRGYPHIYMATHFTREPDTLGMVRYILRLNASLLPNSPIESDISLTTQTIESGDIFALANGETRSKHYSNRRTKDWQHIGATGNNVGVWLVRDNHEGSTGGPFYRSLLNQKTTSDQEITYIVNYGQTQTEAHRMNVLNAYTLVVTQGNEPSVPDLNWFASLDLRGFVGSEARGRVTGVGINGRAAGFEYTVAFSNSEAQYWATADDSKGYFNSANMRPGTYQMHIFKNELAVDTRSVTVVAGQTTILNSIHINDDPSNAKTLWSIGQWDGTPWEFLNGDKVTLMHPSDPRMAHWSPAAFTIGDSPTHEFPAYIWKDINNDRVIYFKLNDHQRQFNHTLRIGITVAYANARPKISLNNWNSANPAASSQPQTRSLTTGSYRGNNTTFTYNIPSSAWKTNAQEWNTLIISAISGSGLTGFLSAGFSLDAIDLLDNSPSPTSSSAESSSTAHNESSAASSWHSSFSSENTSDATSSEPNQGASSSEAISSTESSAASRSATSSSSTIASSSQIASASSSHSSDIFSSSSAETMTSSAAPSSTSSTEHIFNSSSSDASSEHSSSSQSSIYSSSSETEASYSSSHYSSVFSSQANSQSSTASHSSEIASTSNSSTSSAISSSAVATSSQASSQTVSGNNKSGSGSMAWWLLLGLGISLTTRAKNRSA